MTCDQVQLVEAFYDGEMPSAERDRVNALIERPDRAQIGAAFEEFAKFRPNRLLGGGARGYRRGGWR